MTHESTLTDEKLYEIGMGAYRAHVVETIRRVMKGRRENGGNFKYLKDEDYIREKKAMVYLSLFLWRLHLRLTGKEDKKGECDMLCIQCPYPRYTFHSKEEPEHWNNEGPEGWCCQVECECK